MLSEIYLTCFFIGAIYSAISFILGGIFDFLDFDFELPDFLDIFHIELPHVDAALPIKPFIIVAFVTVFGGVGSILLLTDFFQANQIFSLPIAIISAFLASTFLYKAVYLKLLKMATTVKKQADAVGLRAKVLETIIPGGYGRISYSIDNNILSAAAKELIPGEGIKKGASVLISDIKENIFYVTLISD